MNDNRSSKPDLIPPLLCWDIFSMQQAKLMLKFKKQADLLELTQYKNRYHWTTLLEEILNKPYDALVLTDSGVRIKWVSDGFTTMTGYHKKEVLERSPKMLQGENTTESSRKRFRSNLDDQNTFVENLINYRKNGEEYLCKVEIHPIFDISDNLCHFLALEREVK